jgi:hypothetical protein
MFEGIEEADLSRQTVALFGWSALCVMAYI